MREMFRHYYRPSADEFAALWRDAWVVFDSSALLGFYRDSTNIVDETLKVAEAARDRLWLPFQVALEYHENLANTESSLFIAQGDIKKSVDAGLKSIELNLANSRHPFLRDEMLR